MHASKQEPRLAQRSKYIETRRQRDRIFSRGDVAWGLVIHLVRFNWLLLER